jgi:hypothetical protein
MARRNADPSHKHRREEPDLHGSLSTARINSLRMGSWGVAFPGQWSYAPGSCGE